MKYAYLYFLTLSVSLLFVNPILAEDNSQTTEEEDSITDFFSETETERMEKELIEIGLSKVNYYEKTNRMNVASASTFTTGSWSWRDGIICITESHVSVAFNNGHAGIMGIAPDYNMTYEANPASGVTICPGDYQSRFPGKNVWQVDVTSTDDGQDEAAAQWTRNRIGYSYGFPITLSNRSKFYCSHLIYAAFKDTANVDLDTSAFPGFIHPFELFASPETTVTYLRYYHDVTY